MIRRFYAFLLFYLINQSGKEFRITGCGHARIFTGIRSFSQTARLFIPVCPFFVMPFSKIKRLYLRQNCRK